MTRVSSKADTRIDSRAKNEEPKPKGLLPSWERRARGCHPMITIASIVNRGQRLGSSVLISRPAEAQQWERYFPRSTRPEADPVSVIVSLLLGSNVFHANANMARDVHRLIVGTHRSEEYAVHGEW